MSISIKDFTPFIVIGSEKTSVFFDSSEERARKHFTNMFPEQTIIEVRYATDQDIAEFSSKKKQ